MAKHERMSAGEFQTLRETIGTQESVADDLQTDRRTLGRWERGERPVPGIAAAAIRLLAQQAAANRAATLRAVSEMEASNAE